MHALAIALGGESGTHLRTHPVKFPARLSSLSRNDTLCANLLADVPVVALAVKLGIGHNGSNAVAWNHFIEQRSQRKQALLLGELTAPLDMDFVYGSTFGGPGGTRQFRSAGRTTTLNHIVSTALVPRMERPAGRGLSRAFPQ